MMELLGLYWEVFKSLSPVGQLLVLLGCWLGIWWTLPVKKKKK